MLLSLSGKALTSTLLSKPLLVGVFTTLAGGTATVSAIKLENSHQLFSRAVSSIGTSVSTLIEKATPIVKSGSKGIKTLYEGVSTIVQNREELSKLLSLSNSAAQESQGKEEVNRSSAGNFLSSLSELYSSLKSSGTDNSTKLEDWTKAVKDWYQREGTSSFFQQAS